MFSILEIIFASTERTKYFKAAEKGDTETIDRYFKQPPQVLQRWDIELSDAYGFFGYSLENTILGLALNNRNTKTAIYIIENIDKFIIKCPIKQPKVMDYIFRKAICTDNVHLVNYLLTNNKVTCNQPLIRQGEPLNKIDENSHQTLSLSVYTAKELLIEFPLYLAIEGGALAVVDRLLQEPNINLTKGLFGKTLEIDDPETASYKEFYHNVTPLELAHRLGYVDVEEKIMIKVQEQSGSNPTPPSSLNETRMQQS